MNSRTKLNELRRKWKPPAELERCRPREVHLRPAGIALLVLSAALVTSSVAAGTFLYVKATGDRDERRMLLQTGGDARAELVRKWVTRGDNRRYMVEYRYEAESRTLHGSAQIGRRSWEAVQPGTVRRVRYLPGDPIRHLVVGWEDQLMPLWVPFVVPGVLLLTGWLVTRPVASQRRLLAEGRPAPAVVVSHRRTKDGVVACYELRLLSGATASGRTAPRKKPEPIGSELCVLYELDRPRHNAAYPLSLVRTRPA